MTRFLFLPKIARVTAMAAYSLFLVVCSCQGLDPAKPDSSGLSNAAVPQVTLVPCRVDSEEFRGYLSLIHEHINLFRSANGKTELGLDEVLSAAMMQSAYNAEKLTSLDSSNFVNEYSHYMQQNSCDIDSSWAPIFELPAYIDAGRDGAQSGSGSLEYWTTDVTEFSDQYKEILLRDNILSIGLGISFDTKNPGKAYVKLVGVGQAP